MLNLLYMCYDNDCYAAATNIVLFDKFSYFMYWQILFVAVIIFSLDVYLSMPVSITCVFSSLVILSPFLRKAFCRRSDI